MNPVKAMLFDLDGTLIDSAPDLVEALNHVRGTIGLEPLAVEEAAHGVTRGAPGLLAVGMPETDEATFENWRTQLVAYYARSGHPNTRLYDGIAELLDALDGRGLPWGIVTNKIESLTHGCLEKIGLNGRAASVVCGDSVAKKKPHPEPVLLACKEMGAAPGDTVFAGDDPRDIEAGHAAGARTAAIYYGYGSHQLNGELVKRSFPVYRPADLVELLP